MLSIVAVDLDETLVRSDYTISTRTLNALFRWREERGPVVIATGRPPRWTRKIPESLHGFPWICYNGAIAYEQGETVYENMIPVPIMQEIVTLLQREAPDQRMVLEIDDNHYSSQPFDRSDVQHVPNLMDVAHAPAAKILFPMETFIALRSELDAYASAIQPLVSEKVSMVQLMATTASKGAALAALTGRWGYQMSNVVAFGDDVNDIEMVADSGLGIAMANAVESLKNVANRITLANDDDGVAVVLEELMQNTIQGE